MNCDIEMPRYKCHKEVWALRIASVDLSDLATPRLCFQDEGYSPIAVDYSWIKKHDPQPGGYYVVYKDGYRSFSPAAAFEEGYTRVTR